MRPHRLAVVVVAVALTSGLPACGGDDDSGSAGSEVVSVGRVAGSDAFAAVVSNGREAAAYVCDSKSLFAAFRGKQDGDKIDLKTSDGARLQATIEGDGTKGTFTSQDGKSYEFTTEKVSGEAGYYAGRGKSGGTSIWAGWVVLPDGQQRGGFGDFKTFSPAPRLNPSVSSVRIQRTPVKVFQIQPGMVPGMGMIPGMGM